MINTDSINPFQDDNSQSLFENGLFLSDGGMETYMIFQRNIDLPNFSAFVLLETPKGRKELADYYHPFLNTAKEYGMNFLLQTPNWRANPDWGEKMGYSLENLCEINAKSVQFLKELKAQYLSANKFGRILISGIIGPRGDGYVVEKKMTSNEAKKYHFPQVKTYAGEKVDIVEAYTLNYPEEAIGVVLAAKEVGVPVAISFTLETDGHLPSGHSLKEAIEMVDKETGSYALHFLINCAHPTHFISELKQEGEWKKRIRGIRANASTKSHAELEQCETLDKGDYELLAKGYAELVTLLPNLNIFAGCCGTDHSHIVTICKHLFKPMGTTRSTITVKK